MENNVRLYDINNEIIPNNFVTDNPSFFVRSFQKFAIKLNNLTTDSGCKIYSVVEDLEPIDPSKPYTIQSGITFPVDANFGYTIFFDAEQTLTFDVSGVDGVIKTYTLKYIPENTTDQQVLFDDLLVNNHLPKLNELLPCLLDDVNHKDIIQRMLLDFKRIVNTKGTKKTIEKFFNFIGFGDSTQFNIFDEYISTLSGKPVTTITPDKERDNKSGDYWVLYDNYETQVNKFDKHNLPNRLLDIKNLDEFWIKLERSIALANIYFILPEQSINRFTLNNSVNIPSFQSLSSNTGINFSQNVHSFNDKLHIYSWSHLTTSKSVKYLVSNNIKQNNEFGNSQLRYYNTNDFLPIPSNKELFVIEKQIYDDILDGALPNETAIDFVSIFGCAMNITVNAIEPYEDIWCEYTIEYVGNKLTNIHKKKFLLTSKLDLTYVSTLLGDYKVTLDFFDGFNNRERYVYTYSVTSVASILDFNVFNSVVIIEDESVNEITSDIDSTSNVSIANDNIILNVSEIPFDLSEYFTTITTQPKDYLYKNDNFVTPKINKNFSVANSTEMPVDYMDTYLDLLSFKYDENYVLKIRVVNLESGEQEILDYTDQNAYKINPDVLFITTMDIVDSIDSEEGTLPYYLITTREVGIDLVKSLFDLVLVDVEDETNIISIYDLPTIDESKNFSTKNIPLNYDIPLFHRQSEVSNVVVNYPYIETILNVKSMYPRLMNLSDTTLNVNNIGYSVLLGDVFVCMIDTLYIVNMLDIKWEVFNAFTNELIHTSKDYALKYRVQDLLVFDVKLSFKIRGEGIYSLTKKSLFSSYKF